MLIGFSDTHRPELRLLAASVALLGLLAVAVTQLAFVTTLDLRGLHELHEAWAPQPTAIAFGITTLGDTHVIVSVAAVAAIVLVALRHWRFGLAITLSLTTTEVLVAAFKSAVERPRPPADQALTHAADLSFPSGHAAATTVVFGLITWSPCVTCAAPPAPRPSRRASRSCSGLASAGSTSESTIRPTSRPAGSWGRRSRHARGWRSACSTEFPEVAGS